MPEPSKPKALPDLIEKTFPVLNDGIVRLIDCMGSDEAIVQAARVSYGAGTKQVREDRGLIRYLMRHRHSTPFEMCELKFHVRVPMDCWRQWIRHRTANVNEYSTRYSEAIDSMQTTLSGAWRTQSTSNKQGSTGTVEEWPPGYGLTANQKKSPGEHLSDREDELQKLAREVYEERLALGVAREQARKDLPLSTYTEAYWKIDLHNLLGFLSLRMDGHAQWEIRQYADVIGRQIVALLFPLTWEAFCDYRLEAVSFSRLDLQILAAIRLGAPYGRARELATSFGWLIPSKDGGSGWLRNGERDEFEAKLMRLGWEIPW